MKDDFPLVGTLTVYPPSDFLLARTFLLCLLLARLLLLRSLGGSSGLLLQPLLLEARLRDWQEERALKPILLAMLTEGVL